MKTQGKVIRKAVIPVAGLGTRFLPVTKVVPKELLPIGCKPSLQMVIEELIASEIYQVILVTAPHKTEIEDYFKRNTAYDTVLAAQRKEPLLLDFRRLTDKIEFSSVVQEKPLGLGHAILCAKSKVGNEPFIICLPDVLIEGKTPCVKQLMDAYHRVGEAVNATEHTPRDRLHLYGVYKIASSEGRLHKASRVVEKPSASQAPSDFAVVGRYVFTPDIFAILADAKPGRGGEIQLADAMDALAKMGRMYAYEYEGQQFDIGDKLGFLMANIYYGYKEFPEAVQKFLKEIVCQTEGVERA